MNLLLLHTVEAWIKSLDKVRQKLDRTRTYTNDLISNSVSDDGDTSNKGLSLVKIVLI